jgi:hypothetical protein
MNNLKLFSAVVMTLAAAPVAAQTAPACDACDASILKQVIANSEALAAANAKLDQIKKHLAAAETAKTRKTPLFVDNGPIYNVSTASAGGITWNLYPASAHSAEAATRAFCISIGYDSGKPLRVVANGDGAGEVIRLVCYDS